MMNAYDRTYLDRARTTLGRMLDYAVNDLKYKLSDYWNLFLVSDISKRFESGDVSVLVGKSGIELALEVTGITNDYTKPTFSESKSKEYWTGWALAYFQWSSALPFSETTKYITVDEICLMYYPYHEMDIRQFCDRMIELYNERKQFTNLKLRRIKAGLSQSQLQKITGIPLRTIQQYEQRQKDINKAKVESIVALSKALFCKPQHLIETQILTDNT